MSILITGSNGFIAKNLIIRLKEHSLKIIEFNKSDDINLLKEKIAKSDVIIHLAGENRTTNKDLFIKNNIKLTEEICNIIKSNDFNIPLLFSSSIHSNLPTYYGKSKKKAEDLLIDLYKVTNNPVKIFKLPGVFGKWSKPFYNSVVSTFCHSIANDLEINIKDPNKLIKLIYIDDLVNEFILSIKNFKSGLMYGEVNPSYEISIKELATIIRNFKNSRKILFTEKVGKGLIKRLYSTYLTYLPFEESYYEVPVYEDKRGKFIEMLKTIDSGQFSFFSAKPGITRGGHYHNTKSEKFLLIKGKAKFRFSHVLTKEYKEIFLSEEKPIIVDTIPGWSHEITNIGEDEMIVMLWANEIFDKDNPDTFTFKI